jgi:hypothetical protein
MQQYMATSSRISRTCSAVQPLLRAPRRCTRSSLALPTAAIMAIIARLLVASGSSPPLHTSPYA